MGLATLRWCGGGEGGALSGKPQAGETKPSLQVTHQACPTSSLQSHAEQLLLTVSWKPLEGKPQPQQAPTPNLHCQATVPRRETSWGSLAVTLVVGHLVPTS